MNVKKGKQVLQSESNKEPFLYLRRRSRRGIATKLLLSILTFSSVVTLVATAIQLYTDFKRDVNVLEKRLDEVETSYLKSIQASFWNMDTKQLQLQLEGILRFPDVQWVELAETDSEIQKPLLLTLGRKNNGDARISRVYPILHEAAGMEAVRLGELRVDVSLEGVYARLYDRAVVILLSQGFKTFMVSLFILYLVHSLVTRHLERISEHVSKLNFSNPFPELKLHRRVDASPDELDQVVNNHNSMAATLTKAYQNLRDVNLALEEDIRARQTAEDEIKRLNAELEQRVMQRTSELEAANSELNSFCYSVSHDLRAPLRRIEGFRRILNEAYSASFDEKGMHYLSRIQAGTVEMNGMIDSFLKLSRSTNTRLTLERISFSTMAEKICNRLIENGSDRYVDFRIQNDLYIEADRRLIDIMLTNLIENAWKYSRQTDNARIEFGVMSNLDGASVYFLRDNGVGFDMELSEHLFKPFTRLHNTNDFDGIGIGLATVQRIITRHGGAVWFDAEVSKGATFYFSLWSKRQT